MRPIDEGATLPILWVYVRANRFLVDLTNPLWLIFPCVSILVAGAIGFRVMSLSWRQVGLAAILAGAGIMLISMLESSPFYPVIWSGDPSFYEFFLGTVLISGPIFLLVVCDLAMRRTTHTPNIKKVLLTGLLIMIPFLCIDLTRIGYTNEGKETVGLSVGMLLLVVRFAVGEIGVLFDSDDQRGGKAFVSVGVVLEVLMFMTWTLLRYSGYWG